MMKNETLEAAIDELTKNGVKYSVVYGAKHIQVQWLTRTGSPRFATVSRRDSGERHAIQNARREIRVKLRNDEMLLESNAKQATSKPAPALPSHVDRLEAEIRRLADRVAQLENR